MKRSIAVIVAGILTVSLTSCGHEEKRVQPAPTAKASATLITKSAKPVSISIPKLNISSKVISVGLKRDGSIQIPPLSHPELAAWYNKGPAPGDIGPSVILGHVDGHGKQGVFFRLRNIKPKDHIVVTRKDGSKVTFSVTKTQYVDKDAFPFGKVFGESLDHPELRLITCGGAFNYKTGHYVKNLIVYAKS